MNKNISLRQTLKVLEIKESMGIRSCYYLYTFIHILQTIQHQFHFSQLIQINFQNQQKMGISQCTSVQNCTFLCEEQQAITSNVRILKVEEFKDDYEPHLISFSKISLSNTSNSRVNNSFTITPGQKSQITSLCEIASSNIKKSLYQSKEQSSSQFVNIEIVHKISIKEFYDLKKLVKNVRQTIRQLTIPFSYITFQQATEDLIQKLKFVKLKFNPAEESQTCFFRGTIVDKNINKVLEGYGQVYFLNGAYYNGYLKNNQFNDQGIYIHADKDYYFGTWKNNSAHGQGEFRHFQGVLYTGQWVYDQQHGYGEQYWPDGAVFKGIFEKGHKRKGRFSWPNKSSYEGEFVHGQFEGEGSFIWEDNRSYKGTWKANKMDGFGTFSWPNGQTFTGQYEADKKNGKGELALNDGTVVKGKWLNGKLDGMSEIYKNGYVTKVCWKEGVEAKL